MFSAIATLCCAPVLAGVLALSILPGSLFWGGLYAFLYVAGMVAPLFVISFFMDKYDLTSTFEKMSQSVSYKAFGREITITIAEIIAGSMFLLLGIFIVYLAMAGKLAMEGNEFQTSVNILMSNITTSINDWIAKIPISFMVVTLAIIACLLVAFAVRKLGKN